jgi:hypothetical protein
MVPPFLTLTLDRGDWSISRPDCLTPEERTSCILCVGDWLGFRAVFSVAKQTKISLRYRESNPDSLSYRLS